MIVTYERGAADRVYSTSNWTAYRWTKDNDTAILNVLWYDVIKDTANNELSFEQIGEVIKQAYKNRTVKSRVDIHIDDKTIEIIRKGVFSNILIFKNE